MSWLVFLTVSWGFVSIVTLSVLMRPLREFLARGGKFWVFLYGLFSCPQCFGFWAGMGLYFLIPMELGSEYPWFLEMIFHGLICSGMCLLLSALLLLCGWEVDDIH